MSVGFTLPLQRGNSGYFEMSEDLLTQMKSNFINLILTVKGERFHNPSFGCDLTKLIFNHNTDDLYSDIQKTIEDSVSKWMPYIKLQEFKVESSEKDQYRVKLYIKYSLTENPNISDEVLLQI